MKLPQPIAATSAKTAFIGVPPRLRLSPLRCKSGLRDVFRAHRAFRRTGPKLDAAKYISDPDLLRRSFDFRGVPLDAAGQLRAMQPRVHLAALEQLPVGSRLRRSARDRAR